MSLVLSVFLSMYLLLALAVAGKREQIGNFWFWLHGCVALLQYVGFAYSDKISDHTFLLAGFLWGFVWIQNFRLSLDLIENFPSASFPELFPVVVLFGLLGMLGISSLVLNYRADEDDRPVFDVYTATTAVGWGMHIAVNTEIFGHELAKAGNFWGFFVCVSANGRCLYPLLARLIGNNLFRAQSHLHAVRGACLLHIVFLVLTEIFRNFVANYAAGIALQVASIVLWWHSRRIPKLS